SRSRSWRRPAHDVHLLLWGDTRRTRVEARLLRRPHAALIVIAVLLLRCLTARWIRVDIRVDRRRGGLLIDDSSRPPRGGRRPLFRWWCRRATGEQRSTPCECGQQCAANGRRCWNLHRNSSRVGTLLIPKTRLAIPTLTMQLMELPGISTPPTGRKFRERHRPQPAPLRQCEKLRAARAASLNELFS